MISLTAMACGAEASTRGLLAGPRFGKGGRGPVVVWNSTGRCNLSCSHCYADAAAEAADELSTKEALELLRGAADAGAPVVLFSGGEPLLRDDLVELVAACARLGPAPALSTNGSLLSTSLARSLAGAGCAYVGVSLDGNAATHDALRGAPGAWREAVAGLRAAREAGMRTGVRFVLSRRNAVELPAVMAAAREEGVCRFCLYHLVYSGRADAGEDVSPEERRGIVERLIDEAGKAEDGFELLTVDGYADGVLAVLRASGVRRAAAEDLLARQGGCPAGVGIVAVGPTGLVHPCQFWRSAVLGDARRRPLPEILADGGPLAERLARKSEFVTGRCGECAHKAVCAGCRVRAFAFSGDEWGEDPACPLTDEELSQNALCGR